MRSAQWSSEVATACRLPLSDHFLPVTSLKRRLSVPISASHWACSLSPPLLLRKRHSFRYASLVARATVTARLCNWIALPLYSHTCFTAAVIESSWQIKATDELGNDIVDYLLYQRQVASPQSASLSGLSMVLNSFIYIPKLCKS